MEPAAASETDTAAALPQPSEDSGSAEQAVSTGDQSSARVAVNRATARELAAIRGLSRTVAAEIVKGRPYKSIDSLLSVRGIGPKLLDKLRAGLTLD
jgi:DNA uptake protein ComE-like DNA-binding protein